jgi:nuclear pore complex protein Nup205
MKSQFQALIELLLSLQGDETTRDLHSLLLSLKNEYDFTIKIESIINPKSIESAKNITGKYGDSSLNEIAIYEYFIEKERMLNSIEIMKEYENIEFINSFINELDILKEYQQLKQFITTFNNTSSTGNTGIVKVFNEKQGELLKSRLNRYLEYFGLLLIKLSNQNNLLELINILKTDDDENILFATISLAKHSIQHDLLQGSWKKNEIQGTITLLFSPFNDDLKKIFIHKYTNDSRIFDYWKSLLTKKQSENQDLADDKYDLIINLMDQTIKVFIVEYKKIFRFMLARDQDLQAANEEERKKDANLPVLVTAWQSLLTFIFQLYNDRPDAAFGWWNDSDLSLFIRLASDVWTVEFLILFVDLLSAFSCGEKCASYTHSLLFLEHGSLGNVTWHTFFKTLNQYVEKLLQSDNQFQLSPSESNLVISFLKMLTKVSTFSVTARRVLCENQNFRALDVLFCLLVTRISIELKAALMNAIASFATFPSNGFDIASHIWQFLEQAQIVPSSLDQAKGILYDLREIESSLQTFPETCSFLNLIKNLIISTIENGQLHMFESLGSPARIGGISPFLSYIVNEIFMKMDERIFMRESEKWEMVEACLCIFHKCLVCFDMTPALGFLAEQREHLVDERNPIYTTSLQPGFLILCNLLQGGKFTQKLFDLLLQSSYSNHESIITCLKILYYTVKVQKTFLENLVPGIVQANYAAVLPTSMTGLDALLACRHEIVLSLASNINHSNADICLLSLNVLFELTKSTTFQTEVQGTNRLVGIIETSPTSKQIHQGFIDRLGQDGYESSEPLNSFQSEISFDPCSSHHSTAHSIKLIILDFLLWNFQVKSSYNISHFLLGLKKNNQNEIQLEKKMSCLHTIVESLCSDELEPICISHPFYAEKCYRLVYLIAFNHETGSQITRYLCNVHDYFVVQLTMFKPVLDSDEINPNDNVIVARLHQYAWLLKTIAIELHLTAQSGQRSQSQRILGLLFSAISLKGIYSDESFRIETLQKPNQSITKIIELLHSLNFNQSNLPPINLSQSIFQEINLAEFMLLDDRGTEIFDIKTLYLTLNAYMDYMDKNGTLLQNGGRAAGQDTINSFISIFVEKNAFHQIYSARFHCAQSWLYLVGIMTKEYMDLLSYEVREKKILELLSNLLQHCNKPKASTCIATSCSQTVLALVSRLKLDRETSFMTNSYHVNSFSQTGSYNSFILVGILEGIQNTESSVVLRGNYYSSLVTFINYIKPANIKKSRNNENFDGVFMETASTIFKQPNKFWDIICRDATDTELVWQAVAFATLGSLCQIINWCENGGIHQRNHPIVGFLTKRNYLGHFIRMIRESDDAHLLKITSNVNGKSFSN